MNLFSIASLDWSYWVFIASISDITLSFVRTKFHQSFLSALSRLSLFILVPFLSPPDAFDISQPISVSCSLAMTLRSRMLNSSSLSLDNLTISSLSIARALSSFSIPCLLNTRTSTTVPLTPGGSLKDESLTSVAFSPKIARSNFSSGVIGLSPFGVILPTKISPDFTSAPMYTIPASSRFLSASSPTLGISLVMSSGPSLVSLAITSNSSI